MKYLFLNSLTDLIQKSAWRLVRSAQDRFGTNSGEKKRYWCVERLRSEFSKLAQEDAEDFVRSAYVQFKTERGQVT